jgi:hypothetical protein
MKDTLVPSDPQGLLTRLLVRVSQHPGLQTLLAWMRRS